MASVKIGINLPEVNYWTPEQPFIDRMRVSSAWSAQGANISELLLIGPDGLPTNYPAGASLIFCIIGMDTPGATFHLLYDGVATFQLQNARVINSDPNDITFAWDELNASKGAMQLIIRKGIASNIHIVREDDLSAFKAGQLFRADRLAIISQFDHFRVMDWTQVNDAKSTYTSYPIDYAGSYIGRPVPLSVIVALANKTGRRPWINLSHYMTDQAITDALAYLDAHCIPRPFIEYSNEVWNSAFEQSKYAMAQPTLKTGNPNYFYGTQVARIGRLARGHNVDVVMMGQFATVTSRFVDILAGFKDAGGLDTDVAIVGGANYMYGDINNPKIPSGAALQATNDVSGGLANISAQIASNSVRHAAFAQIAKDHGWKYYTYEGGNYHLNSNYYGATSEPMRIFFKAIQDDPRAADILSQELDSFIANGGTGYTIYNLTSLSTKGGFFGIENTPIAFDMYLKRLSTLHYIPTLAELWEIVQGIKAKIDILAP